MGLKLEHQTNMEELRNKIRMMSVNQICVYHTLLEAFNVSRKASSEQVKAKWEHKNGETHFLRRKDNLDPSHGEMHWVYLSWCQIIQYAPSYNSKLCKFRHLQELD